MNGNEIVIGDVSTSFFSVARYYGGAVIGGKTYTYTPEHDALIREDWVKYYRRMRWDDFLTAVRTGIKPKSIKKSVEEQINSQPLLFDKNELI